MVGITDPITTVHSGLLTDQLRCIVESRPGLFACQRDRIATYFERGRLNTKSVMMSAGITPILMDACLNAVASDQRLSFVFRLPQSAALGAAVGDAIEQSLTGSVSPESSELATLIDLFITLLDGLIDETPELFEAEKDLVSTLLSSSSSIWTNDVNLSETWQDKHPLIEAVYRLLIDGARRLRESPVWSRRLELRTTFNAAVENAILAEYASHRYQSFCNHAKPDVRRTALERKSEAAVWVSALVPICMNGWPDTFEEDGYKELAYAIGRYFGWLDDMSDLFIDIGNCRWNNVLVHISNDVRLSTTEPNTWIFDVAAAISFDHLARKLVDTGSTLFEDIFRRLDEFDFECLPVKQLMADATSSWLGGTNAGDARVDSFIEP